MSSLESTAVVLTKAWLLVILIWSVSHYKVRYVLQRGGQIIFWRTANKLLLNLSSECIGWILFPLFKYYSILFFKTPISGNPSQQLVLNSCCAFNQGIYNSLSVGPTPVKATKPENNKYYSGHCCIKQSSEKNWFHNWKHYYLVQRISDWKERKEYSPYYQKNPKKPSENILWTSHALNKF